jgi:hypothetical protein
MVRTRVQIPSNRWNLLVCMWLNVTRFELCTTTSAQPTTHPRQSNSQVQAIVRYIVAAIQYSCYFLKWLPRAALSIRVLDIYLLIRYVTKAHPTQHNTESHPILLPTTKHKYSFNTAASSLSPPRPSTRGLLLFARHTLICSDLLQKGPTCARCSLLTRLAGR